MDTDYQQMELPAGETTVLDRIRYLIKFSRNTQASFGKLIGVDAATVSRILWGERDDTPEPYVHRRADNWPYESSGA